MNTAGDNVEYCEFLKSKIDIAPKTGFAIPREQLHQGLMRHQPDAVIWALEGGKRALFESFGLGKTV
jgi:hypothetical protein